MKAGPFLAAVFFLLPLLAKTEARTFTNTAGKSIEAEMLALDGDKALLKLANGRTAKVPLSALSDDDQAYARKWHEENKNKLTERDVSLTIDKDTKKTKSESKGGGGGGGGKKGGGNNSNSNKGSTTEVVFNCILKNSSSKTVEGITAEYTVYKRTSIRGEISDTTTSEISDTIAIPKLEARGKAEFATDPVECVDFSRKSKNSSETQRETVVGFVIAFTIDGKEFLKECHPENFLDRLKEEQERKEARDKDRS